jgi:sulfite reductase (NADPH) hemoprotein beta-component
VQLNLEDPANKEFADPLYGKTYLPRKFKVAFAIPPSNDVDLLTNDVGFTAVAAEGRLAGYTVTAGGGMGRTHGNETTFPRLADVIGFVTPEKVVEVAKGVLSIHRDFGNRSDRKRARLKYVLEERGVEWFRAELERRLGFALEPARPLAFERQSDLFGWHRQQDGRWFLGLFVLAGRIKDVEGRRLKTALRRVVEQFQPEVRLTPSQNILLANLAPEHRSDINRILAEHGVPVENQGTVLERASMACPAMPTCGLALAESERYLPDLLARIDGLLGELGLAGQEIVIRVTGCPNGCARPYMAEIGLVGKAPGRYQIWLGGNEASTRLNRLYRDNVKDPELLNELRPLLARFGKERLGQERFGDWCARVLWAQAAPAA